MEYCTTSGGIYAAWVVVFGRGGRMLPGWGVFFTGETAFSFVGKRDVFTLRWFFACPAGAVYPLAQRGPKPLFLLQRKRKSGSGLRKRKGRPVEMITDYGTTVQSPNPAWLSLG